jgi:hypothetical protein
MIVKIPQDLRSLLRNHTVNFRNASEHHKKLAEYAIAALGSRAKPLGYCRFRLESDVFGNVLSAVSRDLNSYQRKAVLYELIGGEAAGISLLRNSDDIVAMTLWSASAKRRDSLQDFEDESVWDPDQPVMKAWSGVPFLDGRPLGRSLPPHGKQILEFAPDGKLRSPETRFHRPRLKIGWKLSVDARELPTVQMRIEGAPLTRVYVRGKSTATQRAALDVLEPAFRFLLKELGALKRNTHRPRSSNEIHGALRNRMD